ncbi:hypothetical protein DEU56DRAFT_756791 [Suillus clintonianus]|uniref:uncharacterized protein n=1 Tax=Suillus clintonianus TaxID=1904413 RepID=UPI001B87AD01|nr:uncharacterized protein DEU56DRAFT_756791 [Suillus clintonianus]KAG2135170.1 hypothetical protein DEU56DRAFT_756791 [Suillus clintonianus]
MDLLPQVDATQQLAPKMKGVPRRQIPPGFFDDARRADLSTSYIQSHGQHNSRTLSRFPSFWRRPSNRHGATERDTQSLSSPFSWTWNLVSDMMRRRDGSNVELREPPIVEVPCTAGKPRDYHARKRPAASSSRPSNTNTTQQHPATRTATASTLPAVAGAAGTTGTISNPHITITGWPARLMAWVCCIPIQNTD